MPEGGDDHFLHELTEGLEEHFAIGHTTVQIERQDAGDGCDRRWEQPHVGAPSGAIPNSANDDRG
jgi:hypothetical protein